MMIDFIGLKIGDYVHWEEKRNQVLPQISRETPSINPVINELRTNHNYLHMYPLLIDRDTGDTLELSVIGNKKIIHIDFIGVTERCKGRGTRIMEVLTSLCDRYSYALQLEISSQFGVPKKVLMKFYKRFGFTKKKNSNKYERLPNEIKETASNF